ncbi:MAG: hypothetical protein KF729_27580, partial [Sandaracinaceae bacterium]|nr:hypothetical protein [Sandaracinaceae bacterium]
SASAPVERGGTRPDSIGRNAAGEIDLVHEHKHLGGQEQTVYNTRQMERQREMGGTHIVTMSSDSPDLTGNPPRPRPSGPLAQESTVYYTDSAGTVTAEWDRRNSRWNVFS